VGIVASKEIDHSGPTLCVGHAQTVVKVLAREVDGRAIERVAELGREVSVVISGQARIQVEFDELVNRHGLLVGHKSDGKLSEHFDVDGREIEKCALTLYLAIVARNDLFTHGVDALDLLVLAGFELRHDFEFLAFDHCCCCQFCL